MTDSTHPPRQLRAIAWLRWRLFVNRLRTTQGKLEFLSRFIVSAAFAIGGLGGAFGMGAAAYFFISDHRPGMLGLLLWPVFIFWQAFPIMTTAFANNPDSSDLLRFPLSYRSYFLVRLAYGGVDPSTALGLLWLFGILLGVGFAKLALLPWALLALLTFAVFNLLFMQMVFAWMERWLAQRRTRELMGILFVLLMLSFQLIGPLMQHFGRRARHEVHGFVDIVAPVQAFLPPGLTGDAVVQASYKHFMGAFSLLGLLFAYVLVVAFGLHLRLRAQYRGENLSQVAAESTFQKDRSRRIGWNLPGFSAPVAAVFEKEIHYLLRSGPMLLNLIMPIFVLFIFRFGAMNPHRQSGPFLAHAPDMAFPAVAGYTLVMLTNLICNNFGGDADGIQFFFASPVDFREIVLAKNLAHATILAVEALVAWVAVGFLYGRPAVDITIATLAGLLFAAPVNFAVGNLLSIHSPKKLDYSTFRRQNPSQMSVLISLGVQLCVVGVGVLAFGLARHYGSMWIATTLLLFLAVISITAYRMILNRVDVLALERRETLFAELCRA